MRPTLAGLMFFVLTCLCFSQKPEKQSFPTEIVIGRDSFIDVGPPFNYYDLTFLRSAGETTDIERVSLNPPSDTCYPRAEIRVSHVVLNESLAHILDDTNPCGIPERAMKAELKRRERGPVFSGMSVSIQVECAGKTRLIRADILDRDIFDEHPKTPQYTSWSRTLFEKLDQATGQNPWEKQIFPISDSSPSPTPPMQSAVLLAIASGELDSIFGDSPDRPSMLYLLAQNPVRQPSIELDTSDPIRPSVYVAPVYPPIAKAARVEGDVKFHLRIGDKGAAQEVAFDSGPKMLWQAASDAISKWQFPMENSGNIVHGSIRFRMNCLGSAK